MGSLALATIAIALMAQAPPGMSTVADPVASAKVLQANSSLPANDPLLGRMAQALKDAPHFQYARVRNEPRDPLWAPQAEAELRARYRQLADAGRVVDMRVLCASHVCEVAGAIVGEEVGEINATMRAIEDDKLMRAISLKGLEDPSLTFGGRPDAPQVVFAIYWSRSVH